jgi:hypothetical protein
MTIYILSGAVAMGYAAIGLFFLRFWWDTRDRLFATFAIAFFVLSASRILLSVLQDLGEEQILAYAIRLAAFLVFLAAIVDKNLRRS